MKPHQLSQALRNLAYYVSGAFSPSRSLVSSNLRAILATVDPDAPLDPYELESAERVWGKEGPQFDPNTGKPITPLSVPHIQLTPTSLEGFIPVTKDYFLGDGKLPPSVDIDRTTVNRLIEAKLFTNSVSFVCTLCSIRDPKNFRREGTSEKFICEFCESASAAAKRDGLEYPGNRFKHSQSKGQAPWSPANYPVLVESTVKPVNGFWDKFVKYLKDRDEGDTVDGDKYVEYSNNELSVISVLLRQSPSLLIRSLEDEGLHLEGSRKPVLDKDKAVDNLINKFTKEKHDDDKSSYTAVELRNLKTEVKKYLPDLSDNELNDLITNKLSAQKLSLLGKDSFEDSLEKLRPIFVNPMGVRLPDSDIRKFLNDKKLMDTKGRLVHDINVITDLYLEDLIRSMLTPLSNEISGLTIYLDGVSYSPKLTVGGLKKLVEEIESSRNVSFWILPEGLLSFILEYFTDSDNGKLLKDMGLLKNK